MSEEQDKESKTEEPTEKKKDKAKEEGQFARSQEINSVFSIFGGLLMVGWILPFVLSDIDVRMGYYIRNSFQLTVDQADVQDVLGHLIMDLIGILSIPLAVFVILGILAGGLQSGFNVSFKSLEPNLNKINPINGFKKYLNGGKQLVELAKGVGKVVVVGTAAYFVLYPMMANIDLFAGMGIVSMIRELQDLAFNLFLVVLIIFIFVAIADYTYQAHEHNEKLKMTKQEVKDEHKQSEGDPQVKARLRQLRVEKARQRMMANVPKADVVVTNPTHFAVALKYNPSEMGAPVVVAKGADFIAQKIREIAEANRVPIVRNPPLARTLFETVEIDQEIPAEHYRAVAEIISFVFRLKGRTSA